ncbi:MAG: hypothetical protein DYH12_21935, partial [Sorangiineae bacterium PRO1]|nr:hypothetical protein [Sorangiineae bacterium PRO1]
MTSSPAEPAHIGRYELALSLGQGPLGELWAGAATDGPEQGRVVSIRRIRFGGTAPALRKLSARAAESARSLRHPKVAAVLEVLERDDELVIVSEHVDGESLAALMKQAINAKSPIPPGAALAIVRDAADALIATRDHFGKDPSAPEPFGGLVPDGLAVAAFGETMLTEPGVLAALGDAAVRYAALPYRAPEQLGVPPRRDERADVYSLGVLLWEMLANRPLFRSRAPSDTEAETELRRLVLSGPIPPLDTLPRQGAPLPSSLVVLVGRALFRDPEQRFPSLSAFREAFDELPRDLIAPPEQVVVTLERLARNTLEARRATLTQMSEGRLSFSPESTRATARPAAPDAPVAVVMPALASLDSFATQEAPTKPRRKLTPVALPVPEGLSAKETPRIGSQRGSSKPPPPVPASAKLEPPARESTSSGVSVPEEPIHAKPSSLRRFAPLIVVAVGVAAILIAVLSRSGGSGEAGPPAATSTPSVE